MRKNEFNRLDLEILSDVLLLALNSDKYQNITIMELYSKFIETIKVGNFKVIRDVKNGFPIAFTSWSFVSSDILQDILKTSRNIKKEDIDSGDNLLFIELFSTNEYYWKFFDYLTDYFNNEYSGKYQLNKNKIYTGCGLKISFDKTGTRIVKLDK